MELLRLEKTTPSLSLCLQLKRGGRGFRNMTSTKRGARGVRDRCTPDLKVARHKGDKLEFRVARASGSTDFFLLLYLQPRALAIPAEGNTGLHNFKPIRMRKNTLPLWIFTFAKKDRNY